MSENAVRFNARVPQFPRIREMPAAAMSELPAIPADCPVLIAGPTASGKSALALRIAESGGGVIVNADAIQVFANWRILTARPSVEDELRARHALYGHVAGDADYSVGHGLREVAPLLAAPERPIIVGGTGLYFSALTNGLAQIPPTPPDIRDAANARVATHGFRSLLAELDSKTAARIDRLNPMRVQRAWEVLRATGRPLADWQDDTPPPLLPLDRACPLLVDADRYWLNTRIARRFDQMLDMGALDEARANLDGWTPAHLSARAIGAPELIAHLRGELSLEEARSRATTATRQFAKRQRTWFRSKMGHWHRYRPESA